MTVLKSIVLPSLYGGLLIGLLSIIPGLNLVNCMCCAGVMSGGAFAVYMHRRAVGPQVRIQGMTGMSLGLFAGMIGTIVNVILFALLYPILDDLAVQYSWVIQNPDVSELLAQIHPILLTHGPIFVVGSLGLVINTLFGLIGALIGVSIWGKGQFPRYTGSDKTERDDEIVVEDFDS